MATGKRERVFLIIDGSNFYHRLKETIEAHTVLLDFQYDAFALWLAGQRQIKSKKYCIGIVRAGAADAKGQELRKSQQRLLAKLRQCEWGIGRGFILNADHKYHEKGVDVLMAVDLLVGAYENLYDTAVVVSSDTDLIPVFRKIRSMGKKVEYIGFSHKPSLGLIAHSDIRRLLTFDDIRLFL